MSVLTIGDGLYWGSVPPTSSPGLYRSHTDGTMQYGNSYQVPGPVLVRPPTNVVTAGGRTMVTHVNTGFAGPQPSIVFMVDGYSGSVSRVTVNSGPDPSVHITAGNGTIDTEDSPTLYGLVTPNVPFYLEAQGNYSEAGHFEVRIDGNVVYRFEGDLRRPNWPTVPPRVSNVRWPGRPTGANWAAHTWDSIYVTAADGHGYESFLGPIKTGLLFADRPGDLAEWVYVGGGATPTNWEFGNQLPPYNRWDTQYAYLTAGGNGETDLYGFTLPESAPEGFPNLLVVQPGGFFERASPSGDSPGVRTVVRSGAVTDYGRECQILGSSGTSRSLVRGVWETDPATGVRWQPGHQFQAGIQSTYVDGARVPEMYSFPVEYAFGVDPEPFAPNVLRVPNVRQLQRGDGPRRLQVGSFQDSVRRGARNIIR